MTPANAVVVETVPHAETPEEISRPPTTFEVLRDRLFRRATLAVAWFTVLLVFLLVGRIGWVALPQIQAYGLKFLIGTTWDVNREQFGILPAIFGTLYSSLLGLAIGTFFGLAIAIFLSEGFLATGLDGIISYLGLGENRLWSVLPARLEDLLRLIIELLAAIPSVVYGLWGIFVVIPYIRPPANWLHAHLGWIPIFSTGLSGPGLFPASVVLAIMVLPTISAISRDALVGVPPKIREAAYGIGATRWEAILAIFIPTAASGIFGAVILGFGRALGETMALAMLAGNANVISTSLFSPANTLAALLANHFPEADRIEVGALMYAALVLLTITLVVNIFGTIILQRADATLKGLR
ncbi:MAG TPA: phosphate ABC transporter permease subunit PstC [Candidatus Binataceae bacterium]|nr:phosphate ABC transporter permease subunit PstC [Candidatus Binataceae bacterium]